MTPPTRTLAGRSGAALALTFFLLSSQAGFSLVIRAYSASSHDRFLSFPTSNTAHNPGFIHSALDLTGVGWDVAKKARQFTLVSPRHFVGANHFKPPVGASVRFLSSSGTLHTYTVIRRDSIPNAQGAASDLFLGTLNASVPDSIGVTFHPFLNFATQAEYVGESLVVLGKNARGGRGTIAAFSDVGDGSAIGGGGINSTRMYSFTYNGLGGGADDAHAEGGDSGSPAFVANNGVAALVGTHSMVVTTSGVGLSTTSTFDSFVPHYVDELNEKMEGEGYHMTALTPSSTSMAVSQQVLTPVVRAGHPFALRISVANNGSNDANNLKVTNVCPPSAEIQETSGNKWVTATNPAGHVDARRGGLVASGTSTIDIAMNIAQPGTLQNEVQLSADEFGGVQNTAPITVIESFRSWSSGLSETLPESDEDRDQISLLLEYAFGGDPEANSTQLPGTKVALLPEVEIADGRVLLRYIVRSDSAQRLLAYQLQCVDDLAGGGWQDATSLVTSSSSSTLPGGFELIEADFGPPSEERRFYRLQVTLSE